MVWRPNPQNREAELWLAGSMGLAIWSADGDYRIPCKEFNSETAALAWLILASRIRTGNSEICRPNLRRIGRFPGITAKNSEEIFVLRLEILGGLWAVNWHSWSVS